MILCEYSSTVLSREGSIDDDGKRIYSCKVLEADKKCNKHDIINIEGNEILKGKGYRYLIEGRWKNTSNKKIYIVSSFEEIIPQTYKGIISFLTSGKIKGITPAIAELIYKEFRNETLCELDKDPSKLRKVPGIQEDVCSSIINSYEKQRIYKRLALKYNKYGVSENALKKAYQGYKVNTESEIIKNPYILNEFNVPFSVIDKIAYASNLSNEHTGKAEAVILSSIASSTGKRGYTCLPKQIYLQEVIANAVKHNIDRGMLAKAEEKLILSNKLVYNNKHMALNHVYQIELDIAKEIYRIIDGYQPNIDFDIDQEITKSEHILNCSLHVQQKKAVKYSLMHGLLVVAGYPGTGKTMVLKVIKNIFDRVLKKDMLFLAPTGRAAARMKESSGFSSYTVHRKLKVNTENILDDQDMKIKESCTICDETSMLDIYVAKKLFQSIKTGSQLIILGDVEQLPSVGPGAVLRDIIDSGYIPTVFLTKVFRQSYDSNIYLNCRKIVKGNLSLEYGNDFFLLDAYTHEESADLMASKFVEEVKTFGLQEVCCLTPWKSTPSGANAMNKRIQTLINPPDENKPELVHFSSKTVFRLGDRVMSLHNTKDTCNGDLGYIIEVTSSSILVSFDNVKKYYKKENLDEIKLAYAMTVHKSQGSEFKCIITTMLEQHGKSLQMNLFNTAVSRARLKFIIIGNKKAINIAILNRSGVLRITMLRELISQLFQSKNDAA